MLQFEIKCCFLFFIDDTLNVKHIIKYYLCQDLHDHTQSPLASHSLDDSFLKSPMSEVVMRKANIRKSNTVAYRGDRDRPNKWKRASINGHIYNFDVSELYKITGLDLTKIFSIQF